MTENHLALQSVLSNPNTYNVSQRNDCINFLQNLWVAEIIGKVLLLIRILGALDGMIKAHTAFLLEKLTLFLNPWQGEWFPFSIIMVLIADNRSHSWAQIIADFYVPITELHTHEIFLLTEWKYTSD